MESAFEIKELAGLKLMTSQFNLSSVSLLEIWRLISQPIAGKHNQRGSVSVLVADRGMCSTSSRAGCSLNITKLLKKCF